MDNLFRKELNNTLFTMNAKDNKTITIPLLKAEWSNYKFLEVHIAVSAASTNIAPNIITMIRIDDLRNGSLINRIYQESGITSQFTFTLNNETELSVNLKLLTSTSTYSSIGIKGIYLSN